MTGKTQFKKGDRVCVIYREWNGDWNQTGATVGVISRLSGNTTEVSIVNPMHQVGYVLCHVDTNCLVPEEIYNSPLYQALL